MITLENAEEGKLYLLLIDYMDREKKRHVGWTLGKVGGESHKFWYWFKWYREDRKAEDFFYICPDNNCVKEVRELPDLPEGMSALETTTTKKKKFKLKKKPVKMRL